MVYAYRDTMRDRVAQTGNKLPARTHNVRQFKVLSPIGNQIQASETARAETGPVSEKLEIIRVITRSHLARCP